MLTPENWQEWQWAAITGSGTGAASVIHNAQRRLWRVTIIAGSALCTVKMAGGFLATQVEVPANQTLVIEPKGMYPAFLEVLAGTAWSVTVETIERATFA